MPMYRFGVRPQCLVEWRGAAGTLGTKIDLVAGSTLVLDLPDDAAADAVCQVYAAAEGESPFRYVRVDTWRQDCRAARDPKAPTKTYTVTLVADPDNAVVEIPAGRRIHHLTGTAPLVVDLNAAQVQLIAARYGDHVAMELA